jgi:acetyltransferase
MSVRNLDYVYRPRSVALIGASKRPNSLGSVIVRNLLSGGFDGPILPVHPRHESVHGVLAYPDIDALPLVPDLAIIATPPATVPELITRLGERGTRGAVIISAGFGELGAQAGKDLERSILEAARPHLMRIVGPNTLGVLAPNHAMNASFAHLTPDPGKLAFVTQSGAVVTSVIDWAKSRGIGFSHLVSLGDMADVDFGDMLDYLANDKATEAILLYMEGIKHARKFMSAARAAARMKPVIVVKAGRHPESARAAASHTGALAGSDAVFDAAFRRAGMLRVNSLEELFFATETLSDIRPPRGSRLVIVTNGGGMGVLATDELLSQGGHLADLSAETLEALNAVLPETWSRSNPVDVIGDATPERLGDAVRALALRQKDMDALLVLNCPTAVASAEASARALVTNLPPDRPDVPVFTSLIGEATAESGRRLLNAHGLPTYDTPGHAVRAFMQLVNYRTSQTLLMETPPSVPEAFEPDTSRVRNLLEQALAGRGGDIWLSEHGAKRVLEAYGVAVTPTRTAQTAEEAAAIARELDVPVALKILSPDITHKSDVGGVALDLNGETAVREAAARMREQVQRARPAATLVGFTVQPMVRRDAAHELIVGASRDAQFGTVLLFGQGGTAVELINDRALGLPPLNMRLAREMMERTRVYRLLRGYRDHPATDLDAVALVLLRISQLLVDFPEIVELDINPLLADQDGALALDARMRVARVTAEDRLAHMAIRPYPRELESMVTATDGRSFLLRPIVPEDEPALQAGFAQLTPEEVRYRFLVPMRTLSHMLAARFTQIDYDREMALVLTDAGIPGTREIHGVVRLSADPDGESAEFAIVVRHEMAGKGLGKQLMQRILEHARHRGLSTVWGLALRDNRRMRGLAARLGFREETDPEDPALVRLVMDLGSDSVSG